MIAPTSAAAAPRPPSKGCRRSDGRTEQRNSSKYQRSGGSDGSVSLRYHVNPPISTARNGIALPLREAPTGISSRSFCVSAVALSRPHRK